MLTTTQGKGKGAEPGWAVSPHCQNSSEVIVVSCISLLFMGCSSENALPLILPSSEPGPAAHTGLPGSSPPWDSLQALELGCWEPSAQRLFPPSTALHSLHGFNLPREPKTRTPHSSHTTLGNDYLGNESCCTEVSYSVLLRVWLQDTRLALTLERESAHPLTNINSVVCKEFPNPCLSIISAHTHLSHKIDISVRQQNTL